MLTSALERWRGDAYAGYAEEDWARPEATRLEERRIEATELLIEARLGVGDIEQAIADAMSLTEAEPLRERPRELLMRGLYSAGRQADALREFRSFREPAGRGGRPRPVRGSRRAGGPYRPQRPCAVGPGPSAAGLRDRRAHRIRAPSPSCTVLCSRASSARWRSRSSAPSWPTDPSSCVASNRKPQIVAAVEHPHVVPLYDYWRRPGAAYLVMRLLRGGSVEDALRARGPFSQQRHRRPAAHGRRSARGRASQGCRPSRCTPGEPAARRGRHRVSRRLRHRHACLPSGPATSSLHRLPTPRRNCCGASRSAWPPTC